jgi:hypothetical protein
VNITVSMAIFRKILLNFYFVFCKTYHRNSQNFVTFGEVLPIFNLAEFAVQFLTISRVISSNKVKYRENDSPTERRKTGRRMTERRMTERRKTGRRMTERRMTERRMTEHRIKLKYREISSMKDLLTALTTKCLYCILN